MEHPWGTWAFQLLKTSKEIFNISAVGASWWYTILFANQLNNSSMQFFSCSRTQLNKNRQD